MSQPELKNVIEAVLMAAGYPLSLDQLQTIFPEGDPPEKAELREAVEALQADYQDRVMELVEVASGYRFQVREKMEPWVSRLWEEKPAKYTRALLETLALIAYRQPITRAEIEEVRGVSVSSNIIKTLQDRQWIRVVGHRDVPGRPAIFGTTRDFLDYFGLKGLDDLPTLAELRDFDSINTELDLDVPGVPMAVIEGDGDQVGADEQEAAEADSDPAEAAGEVQPGPSLKVVEGDAADPEDDAPPSIVH